MFQQDFLIIFFDLVRQYSTAFFYRIFRYKKTTFFAKILRHSTKFLRFFVEIYLKTLYITAFLDNIFRQHFSLRIFDNILPHFLHRLEVFGEICKMPSKKIVLYSVFQQDFLTAFFAKIFC